MAYLYENKHQEYSMFAFLSFAAWFTLSTVINEPTGGLAVGEKAPPINKISVNGKDVSWEQLLAKGPVVVVFYRGSWCPFCNVYLASLVKELDAIQEKATLIAITPQKPEKVEDTIDKKKITFPVIYDYNSQIVRAFRSVSQKNKVSGALKKQYDDLILPVPATYVIDRNGVVVKRHYDEDYKTRMDVKELLETLRGL
jgi:peroxiredoxin